LDVPAFVHNDTTRLIASLPTRRSRVLWTTGNLLMLLGLYLLLYVGGLLADEQFNLMAAQGDSDIALPEVVAQTPPEPALAIRPTAQAQPSVTAAAKLQPTVAAPAVVPQKPAAPQVNTPAQGRELNSLVPAAAVGYGPSTITRIVIPKIKVDRKVVEVGWTLEQLDGQQIAVWNVAKYAVGHHEGTANPGQAGNIVLAGHSGGGAYPFNDLYYLAPGDTLLLWSNGRQYKYTVSQHLVVDEIGPNVTLDQRRANAHYIEPTQNEVVTLVTCWPLTGPKKFTQRVIIRALPNRPT
jgi:sortase A